MEVTAYCKCNEPVVWEQNVAGSWTAKTSAWVETAPTRWTFQPTDPAASAAQTSWRYSCGGTPSNVMSVNWTGGGGTTTSNPTRVLPATLAVTSGADLWAAVETATGGTLNSLCSNAGAVVWQQNVAGVWTTKTFPQTADPSLTGVWRYTCTGGVSTTMALTVTTPTGAFVTPPVSNIKNVGQTLDFGALCTNGTPPIYEFLDYSSGTPTWTISPPPTTLTTANVNTQWRVKCGTVTSDPVSLIQAGTSNLTQTVTITNTTQPAWLTLCNECVTGDDIWELRVDSSSAWSRIDAAAGQECITLQLNEIWGDGTDPQPGAGEQLFLEVRHSCNGTTWETGLVTINIT